MKISQWLFLAGACLTFAGSVRGQILTPGGTVFNPSIDNLPVVTGTFVEAPVTLSYSLGALSGSVTSGVLTGDAGNPHGGLTFLYSISNTGVDSVTALTAFGFGGLTLTVNENVGFGGEVPISASRGAGSGPDVSFYFGAPGSPIGTGSGSHFLMVHSDATAYGLVPGFINFSAPVTLFAPVPEPAHVAVVSGLALLGVAAWRRGRA